MLFHLSTLPLVMFLGAIVCTAASRYEDDGLPALTDQANLNDHQQIVYDVDNGVDTSFACTPAQINNLWNSGVRTHLNRAPYESNCQGGHVVSRYLSSLNDTSPKIRNVVINLNGFNSNTGLLTVASYEYRTSAAPWPTDPEVPKKCTQVKTLWNDGGANLGERLALLGVALPTGFPQLGWTTYKPISYPNSEVEQQCKRSLEAIQCLPNTVGSYVVPSFVNNSPNLCVRVVTGGNNIWSTCFPKGINAPPGDIGTAC